jgi:predicted nucleic acid-binding protein
MIVCLDANCVIYLVERNPIWGPKVAVRLAALQQAGDQIAVSDLVRTEALVGPFKSGHVAVLAAYRAFLGDPAIRVLLLTSAVCERAARVRAAYGFKVPDALHLAAAIEHGCGLFLTNDVQLARCTDISVEVLT